MAPSNKFISKESSKKSKKSESETKSKKKNLRRNKPDPESSDDDDDIADDETLDTESDEYETMSESSDSSYVPPKSKKHNTRNRRRLAKDEDDEESDDEVSVEEDDGEDELSVEEDDDSDSGSNDDDFIDEDELDEETIDKAEVLKVISKMFPSKYINEKLKNTQRKGKKSYEEDDESVEEKPKKKSAVKKSKKSSKKESKRRNKKSSKYHRHHYQDEEEDEDEDYYEDEEDDDEEDEDYDDNDENPNDNMIIFTIGGDDRNGVEEYNEEDDDKDCDSDDEKTFMKEKYEVVDMPAISETESSATKGGKKGKGKKSSKTTKSSSKKDKKDDKDEAAVAEAELSNVEQEYLDLIDTKKQLTQQLKSKPKSKGKRALVNAIEECNRSIKKLVKKARIKNAKQYHKLIHDDPQYTNEVDYFKKNLSNKEQLKIMGDLKAINSNIAIDRPYRIALLESNIPNKFKSVAMQKLNVLRGMEPGDNEYYKIKNWVDTFMRIPFGVNKSLNVSIEDGIDKCHEFMAKSKRILDDCVYGLNDAKMQIMQMVGQWIANPSAMGTAIAIKGPMGTGKTSLVKEGISKILGREFAFVALGGNSDASFLEGHGYTYEGSTWGKIVQIIIDSKCMNPVIYFDELDKVSDTPRGEEIIGILTHLTDTTQNSQFHDKYFSEIDFDLSKCLFIFSYNDESKVNPILRDRMYKIQTKGYDAKEKTIIARDFLLPKICEQVNFKDGDIIIPDETVQYIVSNTSLTNEESGVRNLKRCLEIIYTKLNLFRLVKEDDNLFSKEMDLKVSFPMTVTKREVDILIKSEDQISKSMLMMYC